MVMLPVVVVVREVARPQRDFQILVDRVAVVVEALA